MSTIEIDVAREMHRARVAEFEGTRRAHRAVAARRLERRAARLSRRAERVSRRAESAASQARLAVARAL
jgi:hypothetical protein